VTLKATGTQEPGQIFRCYRGRLKPFDDNAGSQELSVCPDLVSPAGIASSPVYASCLGSQLAALLEEEKIAASGLTYVGMARRGVACAESILVQDRRPPPKVEEFPAGGATLPRPHYAWLFSLVDRGWTGIYCPCLPALPLRAGLYRGDGSGGLIVLAVAVDLLCRELRNLLSRMVFSND
jgi:hypothetical protein